MEQASRPRWRNWPALFGILVLCAGATTWIITIPPMLPNFDAVATEWHSSESWLYDRNGKLLDSLRVDFHQRRLAWVPLRDIAKPVLSTVIANEDKRFFNHQGVDWLALGAAFQARLDHSSSRGASTLSMQVAGFLSPALAAPGQRSLFDKLRQMRAAITLEQNWTKDQILETYLNLAGFRGEAQGIGAAAEDLFGKRPAALSQQDAVLIAALLPAPSATPEAIARRACRIAQKVECRSLTAATLALVNSSRQSRLDPGLAPHLAVKLLTKANMKVTTTIDRTIQTIAATALRRQLLNLGSDRARDGAVVVVDNQSGDVLAYIGGVGGDSTAAAVDGASAYRQAGSTLKPFLYAQNFERGYLTPASILDDSPVQLDTASGLYVPQNYDKGFKGPVTVRTALASSLNVPAVRALLLIGPDAFRDQLWDIGYKGLREDGQFYGFSLALGSAEVTLLEQAAAFRALALGGRWSPLLVTRSSPMSDPRQVISQQASWLVSDILSDPNARATTFGMDSALKLPFWAAVKTGTSKAMRDNWCVGFSDRYTVAVWVGNLEGDSMKAVSGTSGAAPVWRDIMLSLHEGHPGQIPRRPEGIEQRYVTFEGNLEQPRREYFLRGTAQSVQQKAPMEAQRPKISNPVNGSIFAIDPDIPIARQRIAVTVSGAVTGYRLLLDKHDIGLAVSRPQILTARGVHKIDLVDMSGKTTDRVQFTLR
jgi:penicillin-binding protein 1C